MTMTEGKKKEMTGGDRKPARATVNVSIDVPDLEAGLQFYASVFGFAETARPFPTMAILDEIGRAHV